MRSPRAAVLLIIAVLALADLAITLDRSTILRSFEGTVEGLEVRREKHPGVDDVHLLTVDGRRLQIDPAVAGGLRVGDRVAKAAWSTTIDTPRGPLRVEPSRDAVRMLLVAPLLVVAAAVVLFTRGRRPGTG